MNIFDKLVEFINPVSALNRENARHKLDIVKTIKNSGYDESGANRNKNSMKGWTANSKSPQEDIDKNLNILRQRSRSLYMTAPLAVSAIKTNRTNVIGSGLKPKAKIDFEKLGLSSEEADIWEKNTEREFALWAESKYCDATKVNDFYELQQIACMSWLMNGDACAIISFEKNMDYMPYNLRIHLVESDRISTPNSNGSTVDLMSTSKNKNRIYNGVEIDDKGAVVAYYLCNTYPASNLISKKEWIRIEAYGKKTGIPNILMIFEAERPEQYRGIPYLAPVIESLKQLTRYAEAELMAAVVNGFFTVFIKTDLPTSEMPFTGIIENEEDNSNDYSLGSGTINILKPGESIEMADSKRPNSNFDGFVMSMAKYIGAALEIPHELLTKSFMSSYSASRASLLEAWKAFKMKRNWIAKDFCQPVYEIWLTEAISTGRINAPNFFLDPAIKKAWCQCEWNGPAQGQIDPVKEVTAAQMRVLLGVSTRERETMELTGGDFDLNISQLIRENELMKNIIGENETKL